MKVLNASESAKQDKICELLRFKGSRLHRLLVILINNNFLCGLILWKNDLSYRPYCISGSVEETLEMRTKCYKFQYRLHCTCRRLPVYVGWDPV